MNAVVFSLLLGPLLAAQPGPMPEPSVAPNTGGGGGGIIIGGAQNCPGAPGTDVAGGFAPEPELDPDVMGSVQVVAPQQGEANVPRNAIVRLRGFLNSFDQQPPTLRVDVSAPALGTTFETQREGSVIRLTSVLPANTEIVAQVVATPDHPCPECEAFTPVSFRTGAVVDNEAPRLAGGRLDVFVTRPECVGEQNATMLSRIDYGADDIRFAEVALIVGEREAQTIMSVNLAPGQSEAQLNRVLGEQRLDADIFVRAAFTVFDAAGNASAPMTLLTTTQPTPMTGRTSDAPLNTCTLPQASRVVVDGPLRAGDLVNVLHPFETVPLALRTSTGEIVSLGTRTETVEGGEVLTLDPALMPGEYTVVAGPCAQCECAECARVFEQRIDIVDGADTNAPDAPEVVAVEAAGPRAAQGGGVCAESARGLRAEIVRPTGLGVFADTLRYHLAVRREGEPAVVVGRYLIPSARGEDRQVLSATAGSLFPGLFSEPFEVEVVALDPSGNRSETVFTVAATPQCGASPISAADFPLGSAGAMLLVGLAFRRRRSGAV